MTTTRSSRATRKPKNTAAALESGAGVGGFVVALRPLGAAWREIAANARECLGDTRAGHIIDWLTADMERFARELDVELLSPEEAAAWSGFSVDHLARLCREGKLRNYGRKGRPLYARSELPRKASRTSALRSSQRSDIVPGTRQQIAQAAITPFVGGRDG